jgi:hypothetical protein
MHTSRFIRSTRLDPSGAVLDLVSHPGRARASLYPRVMNGKPGGPGEPRSQAGEGPLSEPGAAAGEGERYGPLELRRLRKDDGRSLIVYSRVEREGVGPPR